MSATAPRVRILLLLLVLSSLALGAPLDLAHPRSATAQSHAPTMADDAVQRRSARRERYLSMGRAHLAAGHPGAAVGYFEEARRADPGAAVVYLDLGRALLELGRVNDAIAALESGLLREPDHVALIETLAGALERGGRDRRALALLRGACQRNGERADLHMARATLAQRLGAWSEAIDAYAQVIDLARTSGVVSAATLQDARDHRRALRALSGEQNGPYCCD